MIVPTAPPSPFGLPDEPLQLADDQALAVVRLLEAVPAVRRRHHFFIWSQNHLQPLVPHQLLVCGSYLRQRRGMVFDTFHSVVLSNPVLASVNDAEGPLASALTRAWVDGCGRPMLVPLAGLAAEAAGPARQLQDELQCSHLLVHGVARPQRPTEVESLFIFGATASGPRAAQHLGCLDLLLPQLHRTWQRVLQTEYELMRRVVKPLDRPPAPTPARPALRQVITLRECQILSWVRAGYSNQKIAEALLISPLTVKNHVQKILRKLGASNRAQAVALAMDMGLLADADLAGDSGARRPDQVRP